MSQVATAPCWTTSLSQYSLKHPTHTLRVVYPPSPEPERERPRPFRYEYDRTMPPPPLPAKRKYGDDRERERGDEPRSSRSPPGSVSDDDGEDSEYNPRSRAAGGKAKRAAPPPKATPAGKVTTGPNGRPMSREALRKANHSLIERRRREKINFALGELREMVPGLGGDGPGGKGGEFKLEVLERTVVHMRELKAQVAELERAMRARSSHSTHSASHSASHSIASTHSRSHSHSHSLSGDRDSRESRDGDIEMESDSGSVRDLRDHRDPRDPREQAWRAERDRYARAYQLPHQHSHSHPHKRSPPSPSVTPPSRRSSLQPDPNETEAESDLPPPLTLASRVSESSSGRTASPHPPTIASLLSNSSHSQPSSAPRRTAPSPNIYLPFPTPSPTSPFLTYHGSSASTSSSVTGPPEPSPFMAPVQSTPLFGGVPLEGSNGEKRRSPPDLSMPPPKREIGTEEVANLLLAFSSPETRPFSTGSTPLMSAVQKGEDGVKGFTLDGGPVTALDNYKVVSGKQSHAKGKTARDILQFL